jgi:hypothetical protein
MKKTLLLFIFFIFSSGVYSSESHYLNQLLNIKSEKYNKIIGEDTIYDELAEYKDRQKLYLEAKKNATNKLASLNDIKLFSFIGFVAQTTNDAATSEAMLSDFIQVYYTNRDKLLTVLNEIPFLIPSSCYYIGKHFGFEDKFTNNKEPFISDNKVYFSKILNKDNYTKCLSIISEKHW